MRRLGKLTIIFSIAVAEVCAACIFASLSPVSAIAQIAAPPVTATPCAPSASAGNGAAPANPSASTGAAPNQNLSDALSRSNGVICPPANLDSEMKLPTPEAGNTPVIPPPGSPGGDPNIRPK